jgi:hypothetical protein
MAECLEYHVTFNMPSRESFLRLVYLDMTAVRLPGLGAFATGAYCFGLGYK